MWKSCSHATKPLVQIKLHSSKEGMRKTGGEEEREGKGLQRENKVVWSGTSLLCQTFMHGTGTEDEEKEHCVGAKETGGRQLRGERQR